VVGTAGCNPDPAGSSVGAGGLLAALDGSGATLSPDTDASKGPMLSCASLWSMQHSVP
jgi:hypothetical protein